MFNNLTSSHFAIVEDQPGVTRDRRYGNCEYDESSSAWSTPAASTSRRKEALPSSMRRQAEMAIGKADVVLPRSWNGQRGLLPDDRGSLSKAATRWKERSWSRTRSTGLVTKAT